MLDWEDYVEIGKRNRELKKEWDEKFNGGTKETQQSQSSPPPKTAYESPMALIMYIIVMIGGSIFYDRWIIWIAATLIFIRHKSKQK